MKKRLTAASFAVRVWRFRTLLPVYLLPSVFSLVAPAAFGQPDLSNASLEQLMDVQVTSVNKKEQKLARTAAAIFVISAEDIRRSGATNIPDLLRMVPGVQVSRIDANAWSISIRGFNMRYSNKVLALIDGRSIYSSSFSGVYWDQQSVPLEDIERIEVIRGPGGTVWGANAVNGVINIITKHANATHGGLFVAGTGNEDTAQGLLQYGGRAGKDGDYRVFSSYSRIADSSLPSGISAGDGWRRIQGGGRADWDVTPSDSLTVEGSAYSNSEGQTRWPGFTSLLPQGAPFQDVVTARGGDLMGRWDHIFQGGSDASLHVYADTYRRIDLGAAETHKTLDFDFQHHLKLGRNDIVWGAGYRASDSGAASASLYFVPVSQTDSLYSTFIQDEINMNDRLWLTIGSKFEHNAYTGFEFEPGASLAWTLTGRQTVWISAAKAIRQPSRFENVVDATLGTVPVAPGVTGTLVLLGNPNFQAEELRDYEAGYRAQLTKDFSLDIAMFGSIYKHLATDEPLASLPLQNPSGSGLLFQLMVANKEHATDYGGELSATWNVNRHWRISPSYSWIEMKPELDPDSLTPFGNLLNGDAPKHMFQVRSFFNLSKNVEFDSTAYYVAHLAINDVPGNFRLDTRIGWRRGEGVEFSVVGQNLLRPQTLEFGNAAAVAGTLVQRSIFGKVTWRF
ncbi:MAG TPA: TonB-dependent receptor [Bryobacteraceae bacterium]|nr:TonB-dependent receptor [Bryobacteraceae bacterium]